MKVLTVVAVMPMNVITIKEFLSKLRVGLDNPQTNHVLFSLGLLWLIEYVALDCRFRN
jgi:hypothetical protein